MADELGIVSQEALGALDLRGPQQLRLPQKYRTSSAGMVDKKLSDFSKVLCARPITLKFSRHAKPCNRLSSSSHHASDCHIVCLRRNAARGVGDDVHVVAVTHRMDSGHCKTHLGPECGHDQLLPARLLHRLDDPAVLPAVDESAVHSLLIGKNCLDLLENYTPAFLIDCGENRRNAIRLRGSG